MCREVGRFFWPRERIKRTEGEVEQRTYLGRREPESPGFEKLQRFPQAILQARRTVSGEPTVMKCGLITLPAQPAPTMSEFCSRRSLLKALGAGLVCASAAPALAKTSPDARLVKLAREQLDRSGDAIRLRDVVGMADYSQRSSTPRFHLVDLVRSRIDSFLVSHGRGSDPAHSGWLQRFSNDFGSNASSQGAYLTGDHYIGRHGPSMRLIGLDATNSHAYDRAIVVHGAWYVGEDILLKHGRLGRSEGCFAFAEADVHTIMQRLGPGRLLVSTRV